MQIFAFYCIFKLQFFKVSEGPGPHGPHTNEALGNCYLFSENLCAITAKFDKYLAYFDTKCT